MDQEEFEKTRVREGDLVMILARPIGSGNQRPQFRVGIMGAVHKYREVSSFSVYSGVYPDAKLSNPKRENSDPYSPIKTGELTCNLGDVEYLIPLHRKKNLPRLVEKYRNKK